MAVDCLVWVGTCGATKFSGKQKIAVDSDISGSQSSRRGIGSIHSVPSGLALKGLDEEHRLYPWILLCICYLLSSCANYLSLSGEASIG
jgi:hypothetical protein